MVGARNAAFAEESAEVEVLFANMERLKGLTKKIQGSLTRLETSGKNVQEAIGPIYGSTQRLQTMNTNIDRLHAAIAHIRQPLDLKSREDRIIHSGIAKVGLAEFLGSLKRITTALSELKTTNLRANQQAISELNSLLKSGSQQLEALFRDLVNEDARPVEPLHYLTKKLPFPVFEQDKLSRLALINSYVESSAQASGVAVPTAQIYSDIRGPYLNSSLQNLAAASVNTARKRTHDAIYQQGTSGIGTYADALEGMYHAEYEIITPVFSREEWGRVFNLTCRNSLAEFSRTLQELNSHIRGNLATDCFLGYEIIDIATKLAFRLEKSTGELKGPILDALKHIRETAKASLYELLNDTRRRIQSLVALPPDGSAIPATTEVMTRLQTMIGYLPALSSILTTLGDGNWASPPSSSAAKSAPLSTLDVGADGRQLLAHYVLDTVDTLLASLEERAKALLKGRILQGVFVSNNLAVIERMVRSSDLQPLLSGSGTRMEAWQKKGTNLYLDAWKEVSLYLLDVQYTSRVGRPTSGSGGAVDSAAVVKALNSKDKDAIKDKFRNFNSTFDELLARHKTLAMDRDIKPVLIREVQRYIEPLYARFWDRYHELDRGRGKYVRYDKMALSAILSGL